MKNVRKNTSVALQAFRRKEWCRKYIKNIKCDVNVTKSTLEHLRATVEDNFRVIEDVPEEQDETEEAADTCVEAGVKFTEMELLAELERLEKNLDEILDLEELNEKDRTKETCTETSPAAAPPSAPARTEEEEVEEGLEYLRRWLSSL